MPVDACRFQPVDACKCQPVDAARGFQRVDANAAPLYTMQSVHEACHTVRAARMNSALERTKWKVMITMRGSGRHSALVW